MWIDPLLRKKNSEENLERLQYVMFVGRFVMHGKSLTIFMSRLETLQM